MSHRAAIHGVVQIASVLIVLGVVALVSTALRQPILVPSLAACVFLQVLLPDSDAAQPWAVVIGQVAGLAGGMLAAVAIGVASAPPFAAGHPLDPQRAIAAVVAAGLTLLGQRVLCAGNAAGAALAATIALGDSGADLPSAIRIITGILIVAALGEVARRIVLRSQPA